MKLLFGKWNFQNCLHWFYRYWVKAKSLSKAWRLIERILLCQVRVQVFTKNSTVYKKKIYFKLDSNLLERKTLWICGIIFWKLLSVRKKSEDRWISSDCLKTKIPATVIITNISHWLFLNLPSTKDLSHLITLWHCHGPVKTQQTRSGRLKSSEENFLSVWSKL